MSEVEALQAALSGEHAAVWAYGVVGARLVPARVADARLALDAHRGQRDALDAVIRAAGAEPVVAEAAYALPSPVRTSSSALALAVLVEERLAALYGDVVSASTTRPTRVLAIAALQDAAVRAARWRGGSVPFPGLSSS